MSTLPSLVGRLLETLKSQGVTPAIEQQCQQALTQVHRQTADLESARGQVARLTNLYVALLRLFEETRREKFLDVVCEIVISLLGSEDFVVYERRGDSFHPVRGMGAVYEQSPALAAQDPHVVAAIATGTLHLGDKRTTAVVPLVL